MMPRRSPALLAPVLASHAPVTFAQLQDALGNASRATTFRYLAQVRHWRSYNHNGRFYTDRHPDRFDEFGLLSLGDVHFSRHGSLAATVRHLLGHCQQGWTNSELRALLQVPVQPFLLSAVRRGQACRERLEGVFVYLSADPQIRQQQWRSRLAHCAASRAAALAETLPADVIIAVLLVLVRHHGAQPEEVTRRLQGHSPPIRLAHVQAVFERFELSGDGQKGGPTRC